MNKDINQDMDLDGFKRKLLKGSTGESIVKSILGTKGYIIYSVESKGTHPFDVIAVDINSKKMVIVEIKNIPRRNKYPDNGINLSDWKKYKEWKESLGVDFYLIFVDEMTKDIYGNEISKLEKRYYHKEIKKLYPIVYKDPYDLESMIYFPLKRCKWYGKISEEEAKLMRDLAQRRHGYDLLK